MFKKTDPSCKPMCALLGLLLTVVFLNACTPQVVQEQAVIAVTRTSIPVETPMVTATATGASLSPHVVKERFMTTVTPTTMPVELETDDRPTVVSETATATATWQSPCPRHTAALTLAATATELHVGDPVTVTVTVHNEGCRSLGQLEYRLDVAQSDGKPVLTPSEPESVYSSSVSEGESHAALFVLEASETGQAMLSAGISFEFHAAPDPRYGLGGPGPAYWGGESTSEPLVIAVLP